jgi:hypothetical protein
MAHFAELDENNVVIRVLVTSNDEPDEGYGWLIETFGGTWVKTSYNATIRKHFAGVGFTFDETLDAFLPPKHYESWILDEETFTWKAPIAQPTDGASYDWNELTGNWELEEVSDTPSELEA